MDKPECSICDNIFDSNDHRPRVLPCGHGFCSMCIDIAIHRGDKTCAICRREHGASSSNDLPVCFLLEDFAHKLTISESQKHSLDLVQESNYGMCTKHKEIPLYFNCKSHNTKVCHSCAVIDHPPSVCQLIKFEDEMKERKNSQIEAFKNQSQMFIDTEIELKILLEKNDNEVVLLFSKIEQKNIESEQIKEAMEVCRENLKSFILLENKLSAATSYQDIAIQCENGKTEVKQSKEWEETLKKELNIKQIYAQVERNGVLRSCRASEENGRIYIPCLSREVKPPCSARLMKEEELNLNSPTTTVYMNISQGDQSCGRMFIRIHGNTCHGQYFIKQMLGYEGFSAKGTKFRKCNVHRINTQANVTEDGYKIKIDFKSPIKISKTTISSKGMLYPDGNSVSIWLNDKGIGNATPLGTVVSGLDMITKLHALYTFCETDIIISDCGIVLNY